MHFEVIEARMNSEKFIDYLKKLRSDTGQPIFVIADNARYHHSKKVQAFLEKEHGEIMMAFLPAYSPELNLDEQVWNHAKAEVGKKSTIRNKDDMERIILAAMKAIQDRKELVKSLIKLPDTKYAHEAP